MNQNEAESVKHLAKDVVEALEVIMRKECSVTIPFGYVIYCPDCKTELFEYKTDSVTYHSDMTCFKCNHRIGPLCPECWGGQLVTDWDSARHGATTCPKCRGTGRLDWSWYPQPRESCYINDNYPLIGDGHISTKEVLIILRYPNMTDTGSALVWVPKCDESCSIPWKVLVPILDWEEIEKVLQDRDDSIVIEFTRWVGKTIGCWIYWQDEKGKSHNVSSGICSSRQEAVMKAVIKLGEEQNDRLKCAD